ncbi:putative membrane protein [Sphingomonas sp. BE138]|uniref:DUF2231 domain-containing protein n=1 Tax=Sphingomonas sp. BE138 TaxID=2817845 RepID=UPI00285674E1|nr:DUF2231 domain-containing protein [Sphingomonas sp. BE138]MDR6787773.1 putative membrane protein [Sphingomonas sp. BE138]
MMSSAVAPRRVNPVHGLLLAFPVALFPAALAADATYLGSAEMQWSNMAAWAITGALVIGAPALAWSVVDALRRRAAWLYPLLLALAWVAGLVNAFHHSQDAWASVGVGGLLLSLVSTGAVLAAGWFAFAGPAVRAEAVR